MPALSSTERSRLYRLRKKEAMGNEEFRKQETEARKEFRAKARANKVQVVAPVEEKIREVKQETTVDINELVMDIRNMIIDAQNKPREALNIPAVKEKIQKKLENVLVKVDAKANCDTLNNQLQDNDASLKTIKAYQTDIRIIYGKLYPKKVWDCTDYSFLKDVNGVIEFIRKTYKSKPTQSKKINSITSILKRVKGYEDIYKRYSELNVSTAKEVKGIVESNELSEREQQKYLPWTEIEKADAKITDVSDKMLYSLYTNISPRRLEYRILRLTDSKDNPDDGNYIVMANGVPTTIELNVYKTYRLYKQYIIDLRKHKVLQDSLKAYIDSKKLKVGDYLFGESKKNIPIDQPKFTKLLQKMFKKYTGKNISVNILRHSFITHTRKRQLTVAQKKQIAKEMGHSTGQADQYEKIER